METKNQYFFIGKGASLVLKNITIINAKKLNVGAIENRGTLTIIESTLAKNNGIDGEQYTTAAEN
ncbi:MAG: hypothetical protein IJJ47_12940 [Methanosphaera sp.]|nr:hypothetical protein [Methanosphaera sp.]